MSTHLAARHARTQPPHGTERWPPHGNPRRCRWMAWWRADRGSVAAELTLATPVVLLLLVFLAVVIHRGVDARLRLDDIAHQAARAASIERTPAAAAAAAHTTAASSLSSAGVTCVSWTVNTATGGMRPGGVVRVTVSCTVDFGDAVILGVPARRQLSATAIEPVDTWRSVTATGARA